MAKYITLSSVITGVNHKCCQIKTARKSVLITNFVPLGLFLLLICSWNCPLGRINSCDGVCQIRPCWQANQTVPLNLWEVGTCEIWKWRSTEKWLWCYFWAREGTYLFRHVKLTVGDRQLLTILSMEAILLHLPDQGWKQLEGSVSRQVQNTLHTGRA